jgi:Central domain of human glycogen debranching enzyme
MSTMLAFALRAVYQAHYHKIDAATVLMHRCHCDVHEAFFLAAASAFVKPSAYQKKIPDST